VSDISGANRAFNITVDQTVNVTWYINGTQIQFNESVIDAAYTNTSASEGTWIVNATATDPNGTVSKEWLWTVNPILISPPSITYSNPLSSVSDISGANRAFNITVDQTVNVTWYINGTQVQFNESVIDAAYTNTSASEGTWIVNATATNPNGTVSKEWLWTVNPILISPPP